MDPNIESKFEQVDGINIHYLEVGKGSTILFIHGFPTSSYLYRHILHELADYHRVIAIDLPGYGKSDKRLEDSFSFRYYGKVISGFLEQLKIDQFTLGVHDFGGPIGLHWMVHNMQKVNALIMFNTLVYPQFSLAVKLFGLATYLPLIKDWLTSPSGIKKAMQFGVYGKEKLTAEVISNYQAPFWDKPERAVLLKSVQRLSMKGFADIETKLPSYQGPVQIIYGEVDKFLPDVATTMKRVQRDLPQSNLVVLPKCGHFLQEDEPEKISEIILNFMNRI